MIKINIGIYSYYNNFNKKNKIFSADEYKLSDHLGDPFIYLKKNLEEKGHTINTLDQNELNYFDLFVFLDFPSNNISLLKKILKTKKKMYLILLESEMIKPDNYFVENHTYFEKVFTYSSNLIGLNDKYVFQLIPQYLEVNFNPKIKREKKLVLISSKKKSSVKGELYSKRFEAIIYFDKNWYDQFNFFGFGWDKVEFKNKFLNKILRLLKINLTIKTNFKTYLGEIKKKNEVLNYYDFNIAFENTENYPNYVTEKLFDSFINGCIPIYWGAPNIKELIPNDLFIDMRDFANFENLKTYLLSLNNEQIYDWRIKILNYLKSDQCKTFSKEYFVENICNEIFN